jgi:hypothetical protein
VELERTLGTESESKTPTKEFATGETLGAALGDAMYAYLASLEATA